MHDAYEAIPLIEKLPLQIESITTCDDNLLIGTKQGHLLMYSVGPGKDENKYEVQLVRSNKYFSKKPILQMAAVPELQILICLSDNIISVHEMTVFNLPSIFAINKTRGASLFALDNQKTKSLTGEEVCTLRMCVVVKRKLQLFYWKNRNFHELGNDLCVPDVPKAIAWCAEAICVGFKQEYCLIKLTGEHKGLIPTGKSMEPNVVRLKDERLALSTDDKTVFLDFEGKPTHRYYVTWSENPINLEHDPPYLLSVLSNQIEVRTVEPRLHIQDIKITRPRIITTCNKRGRLFVASTSNVWYLVSVPISQQITQLLNQKQFELALQMVNLKSDTEGDKQRLKQNIQNLYAFDLFCNHKFKESMDIFLQLGTDASHVIGLFPELLPADYRNQLEYPDKLPVLEGVELENSLLALIEYLTQVRHSLMGDLNKTIQHAAAIVEGSATIKSKIQLLQIIDTTLVKCYLQTNDALVASLLRLPENYCHIEETEIALKQHCKYNELIILYRCKNMHERALELLYRQAHKEDSPLKDHERTVQYLQHLGKDHLSLIFRFAKWVLTEYPEDGLRIFIEDIPEVENLPREEVYTYITEVEPKLVASYLEHIIFNWNDTSALFHNALVLQYQTAVLQLSKINIINAQENDSTNLSERYQIKKNNLINFLEESSYYIPEMLLVHFPYDTLFEERAILLGKLGRHEQALAIYTLILKNPVKAESYCLKYYQRNKENKHDVYLTLLKMYITPPSTIFADLMIPKHSTPDANLALGLKLLQEHPFEIDPLKALCILPEDVPIRELKKYLEYVLQEKTKSRRNSQVLRGLLHAEQLQVHEQRISYHSQKIIITDLNTCAECKKRIGISAFAQYPSGEIVHFYCHDRSRSSNR